jgi:peroxiredoxin Q/BCP
VAEKYGVWQEKSRYGRTYMGIVRTTYLIDADGTVARRWDNVKVNGHADEVLEAARGLKGA